jgi:hypothetical protein
MEVPFGRCAFPEKHTSDILGASLWVTFQCKSNSSSLWYLGCEWGRYGMEMMFLRAEMLAKYHEQGSESGERLKVYTTGI